MLEGGVQRTIKHKCGHKWSWTFHTDLSSAGDDKIAKEFKRRPCPRCDTVASPLSASHYKKRDKLVARERAGIKAARARRQAKLEKKHGTIGVLLLPED